MKRGMDIKVGLIGLGTVGRGVVKILMEDSQLITAHLGASVHLVKIAEINLKRAEGLNLPSTLLTTRAEDILHDPEIQIVIELIGGYEPAKTFILQAIGQGKHVVTANKALLAKHGQEIFEAAAARQVDIGFEASVGGGIPIIRAIREGLAANRIRSVYGIINGTANYILTEMEKQGSSFESVLSEAQAHGFAEADPTFDIKGIDTAHKLAILASLSFGTPIRLDRIFTEGIDRIGPLDLQFAKELGYKIKLLALAKDIDGEIEARVHPTLISQDYLLATVDGVYNAIYVVGERVGSTMFYGMGAGQQPTATAVVGDVMEIARNIRKGISRRISPTSFCEEYIREKKIRDINQIVSAYYLRFTALDKPGVLSRISGILSQHNISLASVIQKERRVGEAVPIVMMTHEALEHDIQNALSEIDSLPFVIEKTNLIRVAKLD
ncbi:MAG: homoserine dehydrogenase [bacterium]|nr:homoserine dehydrogenase [bacterium]